MTTDARDLRILPVPLIPPTLREAAQLGKLIPFVGAGVSRLAGCPDWSGFADGVVNELVRTGNLNHAHSALFAGLPPRVKLSLALSTNVEIDIKGVLQPRGWRDNKNGRRAYSALSQLGNTFVTTNYDEWLDEESPPTQSPVNATEHSGAIVGQKKRTVFHRTRDLTAANLNVSNTVFHIHGSVIEPQAMIVTTPHYLQHYASDRRRHRGAPENYLLTFLTHLFQEKTVLFVGYGLSDLEILEYIMLKAESRAPVGVAPRHFLLQGFYSHEYELMRHMCRYYGDFGIQLLPFLLDQKGWDQLIDILDEYASQLPASPLSVLAELNEMDALLDD